TSCTFFCRSGFSFFDAVTRLQFYVRSSQVETGRDRCKVDRLLRQRCPPPKAQELNASALAATVNVPGGPVPPPCAKKTPARLSRALKFLFGKQLCRYGLVVVVVVVSSCLMTPTGCAGWVNTTLRTTTRSPLSSSKQWPACPGGLPTNLRRDLPDQPPSYPLCS